MIFRAKSGVSFLWQVARRSFTSHSCATEQKVRVQNCDINYVRCGSGEDAVLLMPGAIGSAWTDFGPQIEKLPQKLHGYSIIAWDPPGYGKSIPPKRQFGTDFYHKDAYIANDLMKNLGYERYSLLGWSDGGISAMILAAQFPSAVDKLVIWGSNAYVTNDELKIYEGIRDASKWSKAMREPLENVYGPERFQQIWSEWIDGITALVKANNGNICKDEVEKIEAKTLIVHGAKDPMIAPEHVPYLREHIQRNEYYEFPKGKHNIHLRYVDEFNDIVSAFLLKP